MRKRIWTGLSLAIVTALSGCAGGGLIGSKAQPTSEGAAALGEGLVGQIKGAKLGRDARVKAVDAEYLALQFGPAGREVPWAAGRVSGQVVPTQLYRVGSQDCRGFTQTLIQGGKTFSQVGSACRGENGLWQLVV